MVEGFRAGDEGWKSKFLYCGEKNEEKKEELCVFKITYWLHWPHKTC